MTLDELREILAEERPAPVDFELAPGAVLKVSGVASFALMQAANKEAEALPKLARLKPIMAGGQPVELTKDALNAAVVVACGVSEPRLSVADAVALSARFPLRFGELLTVVMEQSGVAVDTAVKQATEELGLDPTAPAV